MEYRQEWVKDRKAAWAKGTARLRTLNFVKQVRGCQRRCAWSDMNPVVFLVTAINTLEYPYFNFVTT